MSFCMNNLDALEPHRQSNMSLEVYDFGQGITWGEKAEALRAFFMSFFIADLDALEPQRQSNMGPEIYDKYFAGCKSICKIDCTILYNHDGIDDDLAYVSLAV